MATRRPRTRSSSLEASSLAVAEPLRTRKRKKRRELSTTEQEEVSKHEIKGERFTYRLRSIRDIIKNISTDSEPHSKKDVDDSGKKLRRSSLRSGKRKSIVNTVLRRNFKLSVEVNSVDDAVERKAEKETEEQENVSTNDTLTEREVSDCEMLANEQKTKQTNVEKGEGIQQILPGESVEEAAARKEAEQMARERTLENIKKLLDEKAKWMELYEKYQRQLSDAQIDTESDKTFSYDDDCFSEKQREVLASRVDAQAFVDRLTSYQARHTGYVKDMNDFYQMLQQFKENASEYVRSFEASIAKTPQEGANFETPRKFVTKFIQGAPDS